jgi:hypothetical protein
MNVMWVKRAAGVSVLAAFCLLVGFAAPARAATDQLYASPSGSGSSCTSSSPCSIDTAVTNANAEPAGDAVRIELAGGTYAIGSRLAVTFAGSVTFEPSGGSTPTLDGGGTVGVMSVASGSTVVLRSLVVQNGSSAGLGGGVANNGTLSVNASTFSDDSGTNGGGIENAAGATLTVTNSTFSANTTTSVGGGAVINFGTAVIERSVFLSNHAPINGGAINTQPSATTTLAESTFYGNSSSNLGGALSNLGTLNVELSTFVGNSGSGGAVIATGNNNVTWAGNIIARSTNASCSPANGAYTDSGYNLDDDGTCLPGSPGAGSHSGTETYGSSTYGAVLDAYLASSPASNGGPTKTIALNAHASTSLADPAHAVVPTSFTLPVAIDGKTTACSVPDQRGVHPTANLRCDIGAYYLAQAQQQAPNREGYCSVPGNTRSDGTAITPGTFVDLVAGQADTDSHYQGALPANYFEGVGITCGILAGYTPTNTFVGGGGAGTTGPYPYYAKS